MIEKFTSNKDVVWLRRTASTPSNIGLDSESSWKKLEENVFGIDSISLLIGDNGSGKTRLLDSLWECLDRTAPFGWRTDWRPVMHEGSLAEPDEIGAVLFSHAPNNEKRTSFSKKCIDCSPSGRKRYLPESLFGKQEILRGVTNIDPHFAGDLSANIGLVINRCVELLLSKTLVAPEKWGRLKEMFAEFPIDSPTSLFSPKLDSATGKEHIPRTFGTDPNLDEALAPLAKEFYNELIRHGRLTRAIAILVSLYYEIKNSDEPDALLKFALAKYFRFAVRHSYTKPDRNATRLLDERVKAVEFAIQGGYGTKEMVIGPDSFKLSIRLYHADDVEQLRESPLRDVIRLGWSNVSSGQWGLVVQLIEIEKAFMKLANSKRIKSILLLIDEGDAFLHLDWQRQYISILDRFLLSMKERYRGKINYVQAMIATHSPLLASDVPSQYVNRLEKGRVVDPSPSFAAPYHSLLNRSFGAKSIGAHATAVIQSTVRNLKRGTITTLDRYIVDVVDDPIIKRELVDLLNLFDPVPQ